MFSVRTTVDLTEGEEFKFDGVLVTALLSDGDKYYLTLTMVPGLEATFLGMLVAIPPRTQGNIERHRNEKNTLELRMVGQTHLDEFLEFGRCGGAVCVSGLYKPPGPFFRTGVGEIQM